MLHFEPELLLGIFHHFLTEAYWTPYLRWIHYIWREWYDFNDCKKVEFTSRINTGILAFRELLVWLNQSLSMYWFCMLAPIQNGYGALYLRTVKYFATEYPWCICCKAILTKRSNHLRWKIAGWPDYVNIFISFWTIFMQKLKLVCKWSYALKSISIISHSLACLNPLLIQDGGYHVSLAWYPPMI